MKWLRIKVSCLPRWTIFISVIVVGVYWYEVRVLNVEFFNGAQPIASPVKLRLIGGAYRQIDSHIITAMFEHLSFAHLIQNVVFLLIVGPTIEKMFNCKLGYPLFFLGCGLIGNVLSVWLLPNSVLMGMSGSLTGMTGLLFAQLLCHDGHLMSSLKKVCVVTLFLVFLMFVGGQNSNFIAHLSGGVVGIGFGLFQNGKKEFPKR